MENRWTPQELERQRHLPLDLSVLIVGESPPANGTFFYFADSRLFNHTRAAFASVIPQLPEGREFLHWLRAQGWYLDDLCREPLNRLPDSIRRAKCEEGERELVHLVTARRPKAIIVTPKRILEFVQRALMRAGHPAIPLVLPFPSMGHQREFEMGLAATIREMIADRTILPDAPILRVEEAEPGLVLLDDWAKELRTPWLELYAGRRLWRRRDPAAEFPKGYEVTELDEAEVERLFAGLRERGFFDIDPHCSAVLATDLSTTRFIVRWGQLAHEVSSYGFSLHYSLAHSEPMGEVPACLERLTECFRWLMEGPKWVDTR